MILGALIVACVAALLADTDDLRLVVGLVTGAFLVRVAAASFLHLYLQERTPGGAMFEDDLGYVTLAALIARIWHGEDVPFPVDPSIVNAYVKSASAVFWLFGPNVIALKLANTALAVAASVLGYRVALLIGGRTVALLAGGALLVWPSLGLWSALTLKEAFSLISMMGITWGVTELIRSRRLAWFVPIVAFALPLQDTRGYLFTLLVALWPIVLGVLWLARRTVPVSHLIASAVVAFVLIANITPGLGVGVDSLAKVDETRSGMAEGARSAIVESTRTVSARDGECFTVALIGRSAEVGLDPQVHIVRPGSTLVFASRETTDIKPPANSIGVRPGDIVCIGFRPTPPPSVGTAATPSPLPQVFLSSTGSTQMHDPAAGGDLRPSEGAGVLRNLAYLPVGALFLIGAPFPWDLLSPSRVIALPEMLLWYPTVVSAFIGLALLWRSRRWEALYVVLAGLGIAGVLSLAEGNLGTLVRHRGMVVPYAVIVAAVGAAAVARVLRRRLGLS